MTNQQPQQGMKSEWLVWGVMGRNLLLNVADHGFSVAGYDKDAAKFETLRQESKERDVRGTADIKEFIGCPRISRFRPRPLSIGSLPVW